jgi:hypothetical protein
MRVFVGQIYIKPGVSFPFSHAMQAWLSEQLTELASPSAAFVKQYGSSFDVMLRISAQTAATETELKGPTAFKADKDVEYTVFLPFDTIRAAGGAGRQLAAELLLSAVADAFDRLKVEAPDLSGRRQDLVRRLTDDEEMLSGPWSLP